MINETGFFGLGDLGYPMAINLLERGHALAVWNRTASKAEPLKLKGARLASKAVDAIPAGRIIVSVLWDGDAVESLVSNEGFLEKLGPGGIHISMCTGTPESAARLAATHAAHGVFYVEATVFGRPEAARARRLWMPLSGPAEAKDRIRPLLTDMGAQGIFDFGEKPGAANAAKLAGNFLGASAVRSMVEAFAMAEAHGVDTHALLHMLTTTLLSAPIYQSYGKTIVDKTRPRESPIAFKDVSIFEQVAHAHHIPTPVADAVLAVLRQENGH